MGSHVDTVMAVQINSALRDLADEALVALGRLDSLATVEAAPCPYG